MNETSWLIELENMCIHFSELGVVQRITDMTLFEFGRVCGEITD